MTEKREHYKSIILKVLIGSVIVIPIVLVGAFAYSWSYCVKRLLSVPRSQIVKFVTDDAISRMKEGGFGTEAKVIEVFPQHENMGQLEVGLLASGKSKSGDIKVIEGIYQLGCSFGLGAPDGESKTDLTLIKYREYRVEKVDEAGK